MDINRIKDNNYIKNYFALVLMFLTVLGGNPSNSLMNGAEAISRANTYAFRISKITLANKHMYVSDVNKQNKAVWTFKETIDELVRCILIGCDNLENPGYYALFLALGLCIYFINNWMKRNNVWLNTVF
ncbi:MAG: hypothetical protein ACOZCL_16530 [Bacillota bacterium]